MQIGRPALWGVRSVCTRVRRGRMQHKLPEAGTTSRGREIFPIQSRGLMQKYLSNILDKMLLARYY